MGVGAEAGARGRVGYGRGRAGYGRGKWKGVG